MTLKDFFRKNGIHCNATDGTSATFPGPGGVIAYYERNAHFPRRCIVVQTTHTTEAVTIGEAVATVRERMMDVARDALIVPTPDDYLEDALFGDDPDIYVDYKAGVVCRNLAIMPCDKWSDYWGFIHATGREYWDGRGWVYEYEDDEV